MIVRDDDDDGDGTGSCPDPGDKPLRRLQMGA